MSHLTTLTDVYDDNFNPSPVTSFWAAVEANANTTEE